MRVATAFTTFIVLSSGCVAKPPKVERLTNSVSSTPGSPLRSPAVPRLLGSPLDPAESPLPSAAATGLRIYGAAGHTKQHSYHEHHWNRCPPRGPNANNQAIGREVAFQAGFGEHWCALRQLGEEESGWNHRVYNRGGSGAYGIPQALPGSKMKSHGSDWRTNPRTQVRWMCSYIRDRYRDPSRALAYKHRRGYY